MAMSESEGTILHFDPQGLYLPTPLPRAEQRSGEAPAPPRRANLAQPMFGQRAGCRCGGASVEPMVVEDVFTIFYKFLPFFTIFYHV